MTSVRYRDPSAPTAERVADLLGRMTVAEKVGQLNQRMYGWDAYRRTGDGFELTDALRAEVAEFGGLGALYGLQRADPWSGRGLDDGVSADAGAALCAQVQEYVVAHSRMGIPALFVEEVPHGHQAVDGTVFPVDLAVGAAWDPPLHAEAAAAAGAELRVRGAHVALVCALDVLRDPRCGRAEETYGEDPHLAAVLTTALVQGMQGTGADGPIAPDRAAVVLKHLAGQGASVGGRNWPAAEIGWRELHEIHIPPVRAGVAAGAAGVMAAYTEVDGLPCAANRQLLTGVLREDLGFTGLVMADGTALDRLVRLTGDPVAAAALALEAGTDLSLWDAVYPRLGEALECGLVAEERLDAAVARVLTLKFRLGLFDAVSGNECSSTRIHPRPERARTLSTELAARSVVLLRNEDALLPLTGQRAAVLGPHADAVAHALGDYTAPQRPGHGTSVLAGLRELAPEGTVVGHAVGADFTTADPSGLPAAVALARRADVAVLVLGGSSARDESVVFDVNGAAVAGPAGGSMTCGEGVDLAGLALGAGQLALLEQVAATGVDVVTVVVGGRPHVLTEVLERSSAVLCSFYPGPWGGRAIADVLLGREPVGRLPASAIALPVAYNHKDHPYRGYVDADPRPLRPFGYGLGYGTARITTARLSAREVSVANLHAGLRVACSLELANDGDRDTSVVVQLYLHQRTAARWPRVRELRAFTRVVVPAGATTRAVLDVGVAELGVVTDDLRVDARPGEYAIQIGLSSAGPQHLSLTITA
jgi:beta-glucosidase